MMTLLLDMNTVYDSLPFIHTAQLLLILLTRMNTLYNDR